MMLPVVAVLLVALTGARPVPVHVVLPARAPAAQIQGIATVSDGDTLRLGETRIRLFGIDAPESRQRCPATSGVDWECGRAATRKLEALVAGRVVRCAPEDNDRYGRIVATCSVDGRDVAAALVAEGLARAYARYSDRYLPLEAEAMGHGRGVWQQAGQAPWDWRRSKAAPTASRRETVAVAEPESECAIKGNISGDGRKLYHTPGMGSWSRTRIDPERGERIFCDEVAARAAGWIAASGGGRAAARGDSRKFSTPDNPSTVVVER